MTSRWLSEESGPAPDLRQSMLQEAERGRPLKRCQGRANPRAALWLTFAENTVSEWWPRDNQIRLPDDSSHCRYRKIRARHLAGSLVVKMIDNIEVQALTYDLL